MVKEKEHPVNFTQNISILGCGWLGLALGESLVKRGYIVKGSVRCKDLFNKLLNKKITPYKLNLNPQLQGESLDEFFSSKTLIICFPPERRKDILQYLNQQINSLIEKLKNSQVKNVLFVSSTSVYPALNRIVTENDAQNPNKESGKALINAENLLKQQKQWETTIVRFCGLIGQNRHPGRFLTGKKSISNGKAPVNLIHREDCIQIINKIIDQQVWGETFNACSDSHPKRKDLYKAAARELRLKEPEFKEGSNNHYKIVNSDKLKKELQYNFKYPDILKIPKNN